MVNFLKYYCDKKNPKPNSVNPKNINKTERDAKRNVIKDKRLAFLASCVVIIIYGIAYFSTSGMILFMCKLAQTNILPTDNDCYPYTSNHADIGDVTTNIFSTFTDPDITLKMNFPKEPNKSSVILDLIRKYKISSNAFPTVCYLLSIIENIMGLYYSCINIFFNGLNNFPEYLIIIFSPILLFFFYILLFYFGFIYFCVSYFLNMDWLFKERDGEGKWIEIDSLVDPGGFYFSVFVAAMFFYMFAGVLFFSIILAPISVPHLLLVSCFISCLSYVGEINGERVSCFKIIQQVFKYHKAIILLLILMRIIRNVFVDLDYKVGIVSIIVLILLVFNIIKLNLFKESEQVKSDKQNLFTDITNYDQADRFCQPDYSNSGAKSFNTGLFVNLVKLFMEFSTPSSKNRKDGDASGDNSNTTTDGVETKSGDNSDISTDGVETKSGDNSNTTTDRVETKSGDNSNTTTDDKIKNS